MFPKQIANFVVKLCEEKKGSEIKILDMKKSDLADYFVICTANSFVHAQALAGEIEKKLKEKNIKLFHRDGYNSGKWILLDYFNVVVHIFTQETRNFYSLEELWKNT